MGLIPKPCQPHSTAHSTNGYSVSVCVIVYNSLCIHLLFGTKSSKLFLPSLSLSLESHHPSTYSGLSSHRASFPGTSSSEVHTPTFLQDWSNSIPAPNICISLLCSSSQKYWPPKLPFLSLLSPFYLYHQM